MGGRPPRPKNSEPWLAVKNECQLGPQSQSSCQSEQFSARPWRRGSDARMEAANARAGQNADDDTPGWSGRSTRLPLQGG